MEKRHFKFFICSRDRPKMLERCILSIAQSFQEAFPGVPADGYIFDDSTSRETSSLFYDTWNNKSVLGLELHVVNSKIQAIFLKELANLELEYHLFLKSSIKELGQGPWDLAGVRNFAALFAYCYSDNNDLLIFLDDDILFQDSVYHGHLIRVNGVEAIRQLSERTNPKLITASGVDFLGRSDTSILGHIELVIEDLFKLVSAKNASKETAMVLNRLLYEISFFPEMLPIHLHLSANERVKRVLEISGAALATTPMSIGSQGLFRCYNEDWIWLSLLGDSQDVIQKIDHKLLHAAPAQLPITKEFFTYQNKGDIIYIAVRLILRGVPRVYNRLAWCRENIRPAHFTDAKQRHLRDLLTVLEKVNSIDNLLYKLDLGTEILHQSIHAAKQAIYMMRDYLVSVAHEIELQSPDHLYDAFLYHLSNTWTWQQLLEIAKNKLKSVDLWQEE